MILHIYSQKFKDMEVEAIHDFELHHSRRPKVLVQTAGHVSGACYYYRRDDVIPDPWGDKKVITVNPLTDFSLYVTILQVSCFDK